MAEASQTAQQLLALRAEGISQRARLVQAANENAALQAELATLRRARPACVDTAAQTDPDAALVELEDSNALLERQLHTLAQEHRAHGGELNRVRSEYEARLAAMEAQHGAELASRVASHERALWDLRAQHARDTSALQHAADGRAALEIELVCARNDLADVLLRGEGAFVDEAALWAQRQALADATLREHLAAKSEAHAAVLAELAEARSLCGAHAERVARLERDAAQAQAACAHAVAVERAAGAARLAEANARLADRERLLADALAATTELQARVERLAARAESLDATRPRPSELAHVRGELAEARKERDELRRTRLAATAHDAAPGSACAAGAEGLEEAAADGAAGAEGAAAVVRAARANIAQTRRLLAAATPMRRRRPVGI